MDYEGQFALDVERRFEVYEIHWSVRDVSLLTCGADWSIQSPVFAVTGCHVTKWTISLRTASDELQPDFVVLTLKRGEADEGPDTVRVEWKMTIHVSQESEEITLERSCDFAAGSEYKENLETLKSSIEAIQSFDSDHMTIRCKMIVYDKNEKKVFEPSPDPAKRQLSEDLSNLFLGGADCDLWLNIGESSVSAHKVVACTRIPVLNQLLKGSEVLFGDGREVNVVEMPFLNFEATTKILEYAYSGDLVHVLEEPSLVMLENVQSLDMYHLKKIYNAKELYFRTLLNTQEIRFTWTIEDFFENDGNARLSPFFIDALSGRWRLHIFQRNNNYPDYFSVWAEHSEGDLGNLWVEFSIANEHGKSVFSKMLRRAKGDRRQLKVDEFIQRCDLRTLLVGAALTLTLKIKLSTGPDPTSHVERRDISVVTNSHTTDSFGLLSREMQDPEGMSDFADAWLLCKGDSIGVHNCIVGARCGVLLNLINDGMDKNRCVLVESIESDVLHLLWNYIYAGAVPKAEDRSKVPELREAAKRFRLPLLEEICEEVMTQVDN